MKAAQIVLIEDNAADVMLVELALQEFGIPYEITRFLDGNEAVDKLCRAKLGNGLHPDVILLDLNTPNSDGFEVLGKLRQHPDLADVPIAIISSSQAPRDKHRTSLFGGVRYIEKPTQLDEFLQTVGGAVRDMLETVGA